MIHESYFFSELLLLVLRLCKNSSSALDLHKDKKLSAEPMDVVPERRTKRCSPRFRPGGRFWSQVLPVAWQRGTEMSAPRPCVTDPFHPLGSIHIMKQFLYMHSIVLDVSFIWCVNICFGTKRLLQSRRRYRIKKHSAQDSGRLPELFCVLKFFPNLFHPF